MSFQMKIKCKSILEYEQLFKAAKCDTILL